MKYRNILDFSLTIIISWFIGIVPIAMIVNLEKIKDFFSYIGKLQVSVVYLMFIDLFRGIILFFIFPIILGILVLLLIVGVNFNEL